MKVLFLCFFVFNKPLRRKTHSGVQRKAICPHSGMNFICPLRSFLHVCLLLLLSGPRARALAVFSTFPSVQTALTFRCCLAAATPMSDWMVLVVLRQLSESSGSFEASLHLPFAPSKVISDDVPSFTPDSLCPKVSQVLTGTSLQLLAVVVDSSIV